MRISDWSSDVCSSDLDDAAGFGPLRRLVDQLLEDPRMAAAPGVAQVDGGDGVVHERIIAQWVGGSATGRRAPLLHGHARGLYSKQTRGHPWRDCAGSRSEEHTSELQSLMRISYAVSCLKKKTPPTTS